jgi:hypothetical protein
MTSSLPSSGSPEWDKLRRAVIADSQLRTEIEWLLQLSIETYNPTDRGVRFITGSIGEWLMAFAAYAAGILAIPEGHNANGHDLRGVIDNSRGLWSIKSSYSRGGNFGVSNGQGGPGPGMTGPTVFWSPEFPGMVLVVPDEHSDVKAQEKKRSDQTQLAKSVVLAHAAAHPECVIPCNIPENQGLATKDPGYEAVKLIVQSGPFKRLRKMIDDADSSPDNSVVNQLLELQKMLSEGKLSQEMYEAAVLRVTKN